MDLELRHLRIVRMVAETGSVTKAASALGLAQPALTAQLKRIERALGGTLFERDHTGSRPTALGELVLARAQVLLPAVQQLQEEAARLANGEPDGRRYRIGAANGPILGGLVDRLAAAEPGAVITTATSWSTGELATKVMLGRLDFALIGVCGDSRPPGDEALSWAMVANDPVFVLVADSHPLAGEREVELGDFAREQWAVTPGDGCFGECFAVAASRSGFAPSAIYETDVATCVHLVRVGRAVALCQATFRRSEGMVALPVRGAPLRWRQLLGWHPETTAAQSAPAVVSHAKFSHLDAVRQSAPYSNWLARNPGYGTMP
ncbi:LysR family transcriptional regulator [Herbidospora sp. NBRC 101105]|uniref:LysR family transcriptional regulator n=1 Tax=Herbidospora sp. NBRC 101105 TaxID=3032195 RepID=UPI0024A25D24|nr:LysR family transcriptional regulator [Herbidospora sp. NBRC 101105]GLX92420.1 LysR family transcriptional regulator [Herbidospora sp. NBRC 101105]